MTAALWPLVALAAILGLAVGSFLNVVIYRVPRHESVVSPGSHCPDCNQPVRGRHNVPVIGWLVLRGRCAECHRPISARYPLVEGVTALLFAAVTANFGLSPALPAFLYLAAVGVAMAMIDLDIRHLPDSIVLPSYVVAVLLLMPAGALDGQWQSAVRALVGMAALLVVFFALALTYPPGLSFSDVKLAGLLGLYLGWMSWSALLFAVLAAILIAGLGGYVASAIRRARRGTSLPVGSCLIGAAVLAVFLAAPLTHWYGSLVTA